VALVRADVSKELIAYIVRVKRISELGILAVTSNSPSQYAVKVVVDRGLFSA
jgi:hypothetical protein